mmetsp:Transcript_9597/g.12598  ORF Transcript_9597/g.12598 Transcript_9597/m.12598 type:complete len:146 (+) Transcript_9597:68-505(+)
MALVRQPPFRPSSASCRSMQAPHSRCALIWKAHCGSLAKALASWAALAIRMQSVNHAEYHLQCLGGAECLLLLVVKAMCLSLQPGIRVAGCRSLGHGMQRNLIAALPGMVNPTMIDLRSLPVFFLVSLGAHMLLCYAINDDKSIS